MRDSTNWYGCLSLNAGDALTPWFIERCMREPAVYLENPKADCHHYVCSGSILNYIGPRSEVWGAGLAAWCNDMDNKATIRAVRGPISALCARSNGCNVPDVYGDSGLCVTKLHNPTGIVRSDKLVIVPHYNDYFRVYDAWKSWERPDNVVVVNILDSVVNVIEAMCSHAKVLSSSLHGLVFAQALGIPFRWVDFGGNIGGNGIKYWDFLASVGLANLDRKPKPVDCTGELTMGNLDSIGCELGEYDIDSLWNSCPFKPVGNV